MNKSPVLNLFDDEVCVCGICLKSQESESSPISAEARKDAIKDSVIAMQWLSVGLQNEEVPHAFLNEERLDGYSPAQMAKLEEEWLASEASL